MKKSLILFGALIIGTVTFAQKKSKGPDQIAIHQSEKMKEVLALNESQSAAIKNINEHYAGKISALKGSGNKHPQLKNLRKQKRNELNMVLTADQQVTWKNYKQQKKEQHKNRQQKRKGKDEG